MKISEAIQMFEELKHEWGDIDIVYRNYDSIDWEDYEFNEENILYDDNKIYIKRSFSKRIYE